MAGVTNLRGLKDVRSSLSARLQSKPAQKGTAYRDMYLLSKEKERLETELTRLERQQKRIVERRREILETIAKLQLEAQAENESPAAFISILGGEPRTPTTPQVGNGTQRWKTMPLDY